MKRALVSTSAILLLFTFGCSTKSAKLQKNIKHTSSIMVEKGYALAREHKYEEALEVLDKAIEFNPNNANAYVFRSSIYLTLDKLKEAIDDSNRALKVDKHNEFAYVNRAHALIALEQYDQAIEDCDNALKANPGFYPAYVNRGTALYYKDRLREAIRDLTIALANLPKEQRAHPLFVRSKCYDKLGKDVLASKDLETSRKLGYNIDHARIF